MGSALAAVAALGLLGGAVVEPRASAVAVPAASAPLLPTSTTTTTSPVPKELQPALPGPTTTTTRPGTPPPPAPARKPPLPAVGADDGTIPPANAGPFPAELRAMMNSVRRSKPRSTHALMAGLKALTDLGVPMEEAVRVGMGRFPVGGPASYSHDWWFPRFGPGWRLHQGTDVFAATGTPVRSPADGIVRLTSGGLGGIATYVFQDDGTYFYMAHLAGRPKGLADGQRVRVGDVVGYVGTSGNAQGGSAHLHFEVHPAPVKVVTKGRGKSRTTTVVPQRVPIGTNLPAVDPKGYLDRFLQEAMDNLPAVVAAYRERLAGNPAPSPQGVGISAEAVVPVAAGPVVLDRVPLGAATPLTATQKAVHTSLASLAFLLMLIVATLTPALRPHRRRRDRADGDEPMPAEVEPEVAVT